MSTQTDRLYHFTSLLSPPSTTELQMRFLPVLAALSLSSVLSGVWAAVTAVGQDVNGLGKLRHRQGEGEREETLHFLRREIKKPVWGFQGRTFSYNYWFQKKLCL